MFIHGTTKLMKKNKFVTINDVLNIENIHYAYLSVMKTCKNTRGKNKFNFYKNINIENVYRILKNETYKPLPYSLFVIFEPKPRLIMSQCIVDKIVNHFISKFILIPNLENKLDSNNIATRIGKGSSYGNKLIIKYINTLRQSGDVYCLKLDISKYFYNINHEILINKLIKDGIDIKTINIIRKLIEETNKDYINRYINIVNGRKKIDIPEYKNGVGLSIGAVINQFLAIYYINDVIKYIKEKLHLKYTICYMDDIMILHNDKEYLKKVKILVEKEVNKLGLKLNPKSTICSLKSGINFLGVRHYEKNGKYVRGFRKSTIIKVNKRLGLLKKVDLIKYSRSLSSYHGYYLIINSKEKGDFKMKQMDKYNYYKEKFLNCMIFIKDGNFYKCFYDDAKILWYIFDYVYLNDSVSFGAKAYMKVFDELNRLRISYVVIAEEELVNKFDNDVYNIYLSLAQKSFDFNAKIKLINVRVKELIDINIDNYNKIIKYLDSL